MKILFISDGRGQDYLRDCVAHGFRTILGPDFVDVNRLDSLYVGADRSQMYGKGMTLYAELQNISVDRYDIPRKIARKEFDLVIYGSIHRNRDFLHEVTSMYPSEKISYIDGEDHPGALFGLPGVYFKRELHKPHPGLHPIQFAIPAEKILKSPPKKTRLMAPMDPLDKSTYIYTTEGAYYSQYAESYYAATMMKAGWDCLRHYEIMSQWCLPYFRSFDACPPTIMRNIPKIQLRIVQECMDSDYLGENTLRSLYEDLIGTVMNNMKAFLTTECLATYILDTVGVSTKETVCN